MIDVSGQPTVAWTFARRPECLRPAAAEGLAHVTMQVPIGGWCGEGFRAAVEDSIDERRRGRVAVAFSATSGNIVSRTILPVAGQPEAVRSACEEPVSTNRPGRGSSSTARLTAPKISGTSCHSSIRIGSTSPRSAASGSARTTAACAGTSKRRTERHWRRVEVVLPHARGPTTRTAGCEANTSMSIPKIARSSIRF